MSELPRSLSSVYSLVPTLIGYQYAPLFAPSAACWRTFSTSSFAVCATLADIVPLVEDSDILRSYAKVEDGLVLASA